MMPKCSHNSGFNQHMRTHAHGVCQTGCAAPCWLAAALLWLSFTVCCVFVQQHAEKPHTHTVTGRLNKTSPQLSLSSDYTHVIHLWSCLNQHYTSSLTTSNNSKFNTAPQTAACDSKTEVREHPLKITKCSTVLGVSNHVCHKIETSSNTLEHLTEKQEKKLRIWWTLI